MNLKRESTWIAMTLCVLMALGGVGYAGVSAQEAEQLKTTLTPVGAERAGNKEGTIPEWTGGIPPSLKVVPAGVHYEQPVQFPNEKPLFSITSKNMDQYADKLSEGIKAWLKRWPTYRLDVYPTHRTAAAPDFFYEAVFKNATRAKLEDKGQTLVNAIGGVAFPIPKTGLEAFWNTLTRWRGESTHEVGEDYVFTPSGKGTMVGATLREYDHPYQYKGMTSEKLKKEYLNAYIKGSVTGVAPPDQVGTITAGIEIIDYGRAERLIYQYLIGQRRVRRAPQVAYDTPNPANSGANLVDEAFTISGPPDRFDWKLIGKKEMYIPYNTDGRFESRSLKEVLLPHYPNPDFVRWELHRVWVVEAKLKAGKRHIVPRRVLFIDEDSWITAIADGYDGQGALWKAYYSLMAIDPTLSINIGPHGIFNVQTGGWMLTSLSNASKEPQRAAEKRSPEVNTAAEIARRGVR